MSAGGQTIFESAQATARAAWLAALAPDLIVYRTAAAQASADYAVALAGVRATRDNQDAAAEVAYTANAAHRADPESFDLTTVIDEAYVPNNGKRC